MSTPALHAQFFAAKLALQGLKPTQNLIFISVVTQRLWLFRRSDENKNIIELVKEYTCSTSLKPPSQQYDSFGTPLGLHRVAQKIGNEAPLGMTFVQRLPTGTIATPGDEKAAVTTRILWLEGVEENKNLGYACGSHNRKIYIHGTNYPDKLGQPFTQGCIVLSDKEIVELFEAVEAGDWVLID